jgi:putative protease
MTPLNNIKNIDNFIKAGAEEFYMGFYDVEWERQFGNFSDLNRMSGFGLEANKYSFCEIEKIMSEINRKGKKLFITFNATTYTDRQLCHLETYFYKLAENNVDGIIISSPAVLLIAKKYGIKCIASTMCGIYNSQILKFYNDLGVDRIIFPRDISLYNIEKIVRANPNIEYEIFIMRNGCVFSDSHCLGQHRKEYGSLCMNIRRAKKYIFTTKNEFKIQHDMELTDMLYCNRFHIFTCGLCSIYALMKINISALKIVGRSDDYNNLYTDITLVKTNIKIAESCNTEEEYLENMCFPPNRDIACKCGLSCYYPESRFN